MLPKYEQKIKDIQSMIAELMGQVVEANQITLDAYKAHDLAQYDTVRNVLKSIDSEANAIDNEIIKTFALFGPEAQELRMLVAYLKLTNELLRIAEGSKKYARRMREHCEGDCNLAPFDEIVIQLHTTSLNAMKYIEECFNKPGECNVEELYRKIMVEESKNDDLFSILEKEIMTQIMGEQELSVEYVRILGTLRKLERACDRSVNIAHLLLYAAKGGEINIY
ncbi:MAG: PhoU domain-containing protein [Sulfurimonadaceae bacterium]